MFEETDLRRVLIQFRETVIHAEWHDDPSSRKHGVLRRGVIDWLLAARPDDIDGLILGMPHRLRAGTEPAQLLRYAPDILAILRRHDRRGATSRPHRLA